jgi:tRNA dimethylallyltransferase
VHLIDVADPAEEYNLYRFSADAWQALTQIESRGRLPVVAGGTPLYIKALLDGYTLEGGERDPELRDSLEHMTDEQLRDLLRREDPERHRRADLTQRPRILRAIEIARSRHIEAAAPSPRPLAALIVAPYYPRHVVHDRIAARLDQRLAQGMIDEVKAVHETGVSWERLEWLGLEYRWISRFLQGTITYEQMRETLLARIRRFCKSQDIWFRKMEREGHAIYWIPEGSIRKAADLVQRFLDGKPMPPPEIRLDAIRYGPRSN